MQRMHQSYNYMKAQQKKLVGVHPTCLLTKTQGNFEEAHHWNIQAKFYNENSHQHMVVTNRETLNHEEHGAIMKHKCGKRQQDCPFSLFLSYFLFGPFSSLFLWPLFFCKVQSLIPTYGGIIVSIILSSLGQCSNNDDHHTFIYLQLNHYNSILEQKMTLYACLRRCTEICNGPRVTCMKGL